LIIVSPFAAEEFDAATDSVRRLWAGSARVVRAGAIPSGADSMLTPVVAWPNAGRPARTIARATRDTVGGALAGNALLVAAFERRWSYPADSIRGAEVVARWIDGEPAAIEWATDNGCTRSVAVPVTQVGDLIIRNDYRKFASAITGECAVRVATAPATPQRVASLVGAGGFASREAFQPRGDIHSSIAPWLFALAILAAVVELFVRRQRDAAVSESHAAGAARRAA